MDLRTMTVLKGRYRLDEIVGRGGMAEVWAARDERLERDVAVKVLRSDLHSRPDVRDRLRREAKAAARLDHPGIVRVLDADEVDGVPFLVMERLPGETLADRYRDGPVDDAWLMRAGARVAEALACAHQAGVIHRDVKPGNIMITADGDVRLGDFGIAISADVTGDLTTAGLVVGTPAYLAPERIEGGPATPRSDVYGLGVVLYEGFAGERPFHGSGPAAVARSVLAHEVAPLGSLRPDLPVELARAIDRAMAKAPEDRHGSAGELAPALVAAAAAAGALPAAATEAIGGADDTVALEIDDTRELPAAVAPATAGLSAGVLSSLREAAARGRDAASERWGALDHGQRTVLRRLALGAAAAMVVLVLAVGALVASRGGETPAEVEQHPVAETAPAATDTVPQEPQEPPSHAKEGRGGEGGGDDDDDKDDKDRGKGGKDD